MNFSLKFDLNIQKYLANEIYQTDTTTLWEHKTFNIHRGLIFLKATQQEFSELRVVVDNFVKKYYHPSWWRGFAYGVVIESRTPIETNILSEIIDNYAKNKGTLQWVINYSEKEMSLTSTHMWTSGYLFPLYLSLLNSFKHHNYNIKQSFKKTPTFFKIANKVSRVKFQELDSHNGI
jgi:hypothetical protein